MSTGKTRLELILDLNNRIEPGLANAKYGCFTN